MSRWARCLIGALVALNVAILGVELARRGAPIGAGGGAQAPQRSAVWALEPVGRAEAAGLFGGASGRRTALVDAAERASPSVVSLSAVILQTFRNYGPFFDDFFDPFVPFQLFEQEIPILGSGLIAGEDGFILTNFHVVEGASAITATLPDGRSFEARLVDADTVVDVAVLKIEAQGLAAARLGTAKDLMIGESVLAIGNPFGLFDEDPRPSVSVGVVSATNRFFRPEATSAGGAPRVYQNMIQTDAAINPGNSGGPLVNVLGEVIGINTFIYSKTGGSQGIGFAIPVDRAKGIYDEVRKYGRVRTLLMDFQAYTINRAVIRYLGLPAETTGAIVVKILAERGPAVEAGLDRGDIIVRADDKPIRSWEDLYSYFVSLQVGAKVEFEVIREGRRLKLAYTVREAG